MKYDMDYSKLKGKIIEKFGSQKVFAKWVKKSDAYVSGILNGRYYLDTNDIIDWANVLDIPIDMMHEYFFTIQVHKSDGTN